MLRCRYDSIVMNSTPETVTTCEACERITHVVRIEDDDPVEPYMLCQDCANRLRLRALRPLEWFNLASKHGWHKYLLHDDFYDDDGTAIQPDIEHYSIDGMPAPSLEKVATSAERLLDYCFTRWSLQDAELNALSALHSENLFAALTKRATTGNTHIRAIALTICANVLGAAANTWVREQYERSSEEDLLFSWAEAAARCLPQQEGLEKTINALAMYKERELNDRMGALSWFRSATVLDWIEGNAPRSNISNQWGQLAAVSNLSWDRVEQWLERGRPLSLIALDALDQFMHLPRHAPLVLQLRPVLAGVADHETVLRALEFQMLNDPAPRSIKNCETLIKNIKKIHISD